MKTSDLARVREILMAVIVGLYGASVLAQEEQEGVVSALCCICADFYEIGRAGFDSFNHDHIGVCGDCCAMYEDLYGSLDDAVTSIKDQIHNLGLKGRQLHSGMSTAVQDWDNEWNEFWGTTDEQAWRGGTMTNFATAVVALALMPGSGRVVKAAQYINSGTQLHHTPTDWTNISSLGLQVISEEELRKLIQQRQWIEVFEDEWRHYRLTGNTKEYVANLHDLGRRYQKQILQGHEFAKAAQNAGVVVDLINFYQAGDALANNIGEWIVSRREALRLKAEIEAVEAQIEVLTKERQCLEAELEYRRSGGGGGGDDGFTVSFDRDGAWGPSPLGFNVPVAAPSARQDPEDAIDFGPMPEPDPTQPEEIVMLRVQGSLEALKAQLDECEAAYVEVVLPLIITLRTVEMTEADAPLVAAACTEALPYAQTIEELFPKIISDSRFLLQQFSDDTLYLYEDAANHDRFKLTSSSIKFHIADWVPPYDTFGWRGLAPAGAGYAGRVDIVSIDDLRLVPPGRYDILWAQNFPQWEQPTVWQTIEIDEGQIIDVSIDSGAKVDAAAWVIPIDENWGWWGAAPVRDAEGNATDWNARINWNVSSEAPIVLPPGNYDIYWAQGFHQRETPIRIASDVTIGAGELKPIPANSGIRLHGEPPMDDYGWWAVVPVGGGEDDWINISKGVTDQPLVVAPGTYDILYNAGLGHDTVRIGEQVVVKQGQLVEIDAGGK